ncbi:MAG: hypothetical protein DA408_03265 [Bacteroidetes bacterium]|nr:MAG: hypothetical protein C7N36_17695 [Bacteroidota bacterium]PTM14305.1 MAG: hypothetical protein DA408_03265 [Bacteroidota bacterium]
MKRINFPHLALLLVSLVFITTSCFKDLDVQPIDPDDTTANVVYENPAAYRQVLAKLYAGFAVSGQSGPDGQPDINGIDEGFSTYLRQYWKAQELTTDEAVIAWNDGNIHDYEQMDWDANNEFIRAMYDRLYFQIALCNEFLRESTDAKLDSRGQGSIKAEVANYRTEARFLRALSYWHALDMFGNVPFVVEADGVGSYLPEQIARADLFAWLENEIKDLEPLMLAPRSNEYGRADQAALWMLAAKLYLNGEVYTGQNYASEAVAFCAKVINAGYQLEGDYKHLFLADNDNSSEIIFPVLFDGNNTRTWGGMTFVMHAAIGGDMNAAEFGMDGGWGGLRTTSAFVGKFPEVGGPVVNAVLGTRNFPRLNIPGSYQGWDPTNNATAIASANDDGIYTGFLYFPADNLDFKIAAGGWDNNWGDNGADGTLEPGGDNLTAPAAGFYRLDVNLPNLTYTLQPSNWGLIGSATPGGWDNDTNMTFNTTTGAWEVSLDLIAGEAKFRENDGWDVNFGDSGANASLELGGDNIAIPGGGNYTIKLYLGNEDYTYSVVSNSVDNRKLFFTQNQSLEITDVSQFNQGYAIAKYRNVDRNGNNGKDLTFPDTDFPMFRLADAYLMYAEATLRGGNGNPGLALEYANLVRNRAGAGNISASDLTLDYLLDERARELQWECHRRTDLIRFGQFTDGSYVWPLKGNSLTGTQVGRFRNLFPIPSSDLGVNPKLRQNTGYN